MRMEVVLVWGTQDDERIVTMGSHRVRSLRQGAVQYSHNVRRWCAQRVLCVYAVMIEHALDDNVRHEH